MTLGRASAHPTKSFFVRMLTRDISLEDCILDLIDNSIDAAWSSSGANRAAFEPGTDLDPYRVELVVSPNSFQIDDNCGGLSLDDAMNYAFTFGRKTEQPRDASDDFSIGVYGIGMKRAIFKIGNRIMVTSTHKDNGGTQSFAVPINVTDWLADEGDVWDFDIKESEELPQPGVRITVEELTEDTAGSFENPTFVPALRRTLSRDYLVPLNQGLTLVVNGEPVEGWALGLQEGGSFAPFHHAYEDNGVQAKVVAGMLHAPSDDDSPDETNRTAEYGWYVVCNGRAVVSADKTQLTGWGHNDMPRWHPQYGGFAGIVFFNAADPSHLPMTTTKRSVDASAGVYRRALAHMSRATRQWINYTNDRKADVEQAKEFEEQTKTVPIFDIKPSDKVVVPQIAKKSAGPKMGNVNYRMPVPRIRALGEALGTEYLSYRDVGIKSFEYAYEMLVDEDDEE